ncbi:MAG: hypothetical protein ACOCRX_00300 [Candidatus Woesearchaeota archaeon]
MSLEKEQGGTDSIDLFAHHMHGEPSSYGEMILNHRTNEKSLRDYINYIDTQNRPIKGINHNLDYVEIRKHVPEEFNLIFNNTSHFCKQEYLSDILYNEIKDEGGKFEKFPKHLYFELDGKKAVVINSSEVGVSDFGYDNRHFTVTGLDCGYEEYVDMSLDELIDLGKEAEITSPSHPYLPTYTIGKEFLYNFLETSKKEGITSALNYSTGYFPIANKISQGKIQKHFTFLEFISDLDILPSSIVEHLRIEQDIIELANEYDVPLLPELDGHSVLTKKCDGYGVLKNSAVDDFMRGDFPKDKLFDFEIIRYGKNEGITLFEFIKNFSDIVPGWNYDEGIAKSLRKRIMPEILNYSKKDYKKSFEKNLHTLDEMNLEEVIRNTYDPYNQ